MRKPNRLAGWGALGLALLMAACSSNARLLKAKGESKKSDIFQEVVNGSATPKGYAEIEISTSVKTHTRDYYLLEPESSRHGRSAYPFLLNIDGQAVVWKVDGMEATDPDRLADDSRNPESGKGFRYLLAKKIRIAAGSHRIFFGLPEEDVVHELEVDSKEGRIYSLNLSPVYEKRGKQPRRFTAGVSSLTHSFADVTLDRMEGSKYKK